MEESPIDHVKAGKAFYRNGWIVGFLVVAVTSIAALAIFRNAYKPLDFLFMVWLPIGIAIGVLVGLAVEYQTIPREKKYTIGLVALTGLFIYFILLCVYLFLRVG